MTLGSHSSMGSLISGTMFIRLVYYVCTYYVVDTDVRMLASCQVICRGRILTNLGETETKKRKKKTRNGKTRTGEDHKKKK